MSAFDGSARPPSAPVSYRPGLMAVLRLFAAAREAAGTNRDEMPGTSVAEVLEGAKARYGAGFVALLPTCRVWVNGEPAEPDTAVADGDEVAVLPPVSGG
jgi:molybdopterin converting factor small subunit